MSLPGITKQNNKGTTVTLLKILLSMLRVKDMGAKDKPERLQNQTIDIPIPGSWRTISTAGWLSTDFTRQYVYTPARYSGQKTLNSAWYVASGTITIAKGAYNGAKDGAQRGGTYGQAMGTKHGPAVGGKIGRIVAESSTCKIIGIPLMGDWGEEVGRQAGEKVGPTVGWFAGIAVGIPYGVAEKGVKEINKWTSPDDCAKDTKKTSDDSSKK